MLERPVVYISVSQRDLKRVAKEFKDLCGLFQPLEDQEIIKLIAEPFATLNEIQKVFKDNLGRVKIFHFAGHCDGEFLYLDENEEFPIINMGPFLKSLGKREGLSLVFLNCCHSGKLWDQLISSDIERFIVTNKNVDDGLAWIYSTSFYESLLNGKRIKDAIDEAGDEVEIRHTRENPLRGFEIDSPDEHSSPSTWWSYHGPGGGNLTFFELIQIPSKKKTTLKHRILGYGKKFWAQVIIWIGVVSGAITIYSFWITSNDTVSNPRVEGTELLDKNPDSVLLRIEDSSLPNKNISVPKKSTKPSESDGRQKDPEKTPKEKTFILKGRAINNQGKGITGANIWIEFKRRDKLYKSQTDSSGNFIMEISGISSEPIEIKVSQKGYKIVSENTVLKNKVFDTFQLLPEKN